MGGEGSIPQGFAEMTPLFHVRPKKGEVCFTVSNVGEVDLPPMVVVRRPCSRRCLKKKNFMNTNRKFVAHFSACSYLPVSNVVTEPPVPPPEQKTP